MPVHRREGGTGAANGVPARRRDGRGPLGLDAAGILPRGTIGPPRDSDASERNGAGWLTGRGLGDRAAAVTIGPPRDLRRADGPGPGDRAAAVSIGPPRDSDASERNGAGWLADGPGPGRPSRRGGDRPASGL